MTGFQNKKKSTLPNTHSGQTKVHREKQIGQITQN